MNFLSSLPGRCEGTHSGGTSASTSSQSVQKKKIQFCFLMPYSVLFRKPQAKHDPQL